MKQDSAITIKGLRKSYGAVQALQGLDLEVQRGEIFGFLGPNGAGKTTTIRCLLDLIRPDGGQIRLLGIDPQADPVAAQVQVGYLPGELQLDNNLTAGRQLRFLAEMRTGGRPDLDYAKNLADQLQLDLDRPIKNLSKGNKQKVGVVQALMHRPELLLLDEPTSGLDPLMQGKVTSLIRQARDEGATVFFSSHIMSEVEVVAERVGIIRQGQIVEVAKTAALQGRTLRHVKVRFKRPVDWSSLTGLAGVTMLNSGDPTGASLQVDGDMELFVRALSEFPIADLETVRPSLEELFLTYYR